MKVVRYPFGPCVDKRHLSCGVQYPDSGHMRQCSCTCHNRSEEPVNFEIKTSSKVTSVRVDMTYEVALATIAAVRFHWGEDDSTYIQWMRVRDAIEKAESE